MEQPVIAIATCAGIPDLNDEGKLLCSALRRRGIGAVPVVWNSGARWDQFAAVLIRTAEDYFYTPAEFLGWAKAIGPRLFNPPDIVAWNIDKRYLDELSSHGVLTVATEYIPPGSTSAGTLRFPESAFVVKPAISAGSNSTAVYDAAGTDEARRHIASLHAQGRTVMLQPYYAAVDTDGETAVVYIDGRVSHCMRKERLLRVGQPPADSMVEEMSRREPEPDVLELADRAHELVAARFGVPLYARVDVLRDDEGQPAVIELELIEPLLFLEYCPQSIDLLVTSLLQRAGLLSATVTPTR